MSEGDSYEVLLARLEGRVEVLNTQIDLHTKQAVADRTHLRSDFEQFKKDFDEKISSLQTEVAKLVGKSAIIVLIISALVTFGLTTVSAEDFRVATTAAILPKTELSTNRIRVTPDDE